MANNIPLYGANKDGGDLGDLQDFVNGSLKVAEYSLNHDANDADVTLVTVGAEGLEMLGYSLYVTNVKGSAGDFQANVEVNGVAGTLSAAGSAAEVFGGGGTLVNTETVKLVLTGTALDTADVRVIVWGSVNTNAT
jgi:hypothetical protein